MRSEDELRARRAEHCVGGVGMVQSRFEDLKCGSW